jgi:SPP1 gp7 family putative phage head morphogenesis protein
VWPLGFEAVDFDDAVEWFRKRTPITAEAYAELEAQAKRRAFTVAGVAELDTVADVWRGIDKAVASGTTFEDFKADVGAKLEKAWGGDDPWRLETIFRTNVQSAYGAGRWKAVTDPDVLESRPFLRFDAILDGRETPICRECDGTILPASHAWWNDHVVPLHFNCRSAILSLTADEIDEYGGETAKPSTRTPPDGFGLVPDGATDFKPDLSSYPEQLAFTFTEKVEVQQASSFDRWVKHYEGYGEAAKSLAWGRVSEERGLALPIADAIKMLEGTDLDIGRRAAHYLKFAKADDASINSLDDLARWAKEATAAGRQAFAKAPDEIRAAAALAGHVERISPAGQLNVSLKLAGKSKKARDEDRQRFNAFQRAMGAVLDKSATPSKQVNATIGSISRAYYQAGNARLLRSDSRPQIIAHEFAHAIEHLNERAFARSLAFLDKRTEADKVEEMGNLPGFEHYPDGEITKKDRFRNPYIGRQYVEAGGALRATEVLSVGTEYLFGPEAGDFLVDDPEHFFFTLGQWAGEHAE